MPTRNAARCTVTLLVLAFGTLLGARNRQDHTASTAAAAFRTSSNLVLINASVEDDQGRPVTGLDATGFHVIESGEEQKLVSFNQGDMPISMILVFDTSASMRALSGRAAEAASLLLKDPNPQDEFAVVEFADRPSLALDWTRDTSSVRDCLLRAEPHGNTALLDAVVSAGSMARRAANERRIAVVISDGIDNHSRRSVAGVRRFLQEANVQVYAIDIVNTKGLYNVTPWDEDGLLEPICRAGGGRWIQVEGDTNLPVAVEQVAQEIRTQYILGYQPASLSQPGKYHHVDLKVSPAAGAGRLSISWRHGYYEPRQ